MMKNGYQKATIGGFTVEVFTNYDGVELYVTDANGGKLYAAKVSGDPMARAREVIARETAPTAAATAAKTINFTEREQEFYNAVTRAQNGDLEVFEDFEIGGFVVKNFENDKEYRVCLEVTDGRIQGSCDCKDFFYRSRICKHISKVLAKRMTPAVFA